MARRLFAEVTGRPPTDEEKVPEFFSGYKSALHFLDTAYNTTGNISALIIRSDAPALGLSSMFARFSDSWARAKTLTGSVKAGSFPRGNGVVFYPPRGFYRTGVQESGTKWPETVPAVDGPLEIDTLINYLENRYRIHAYRSDRVGILYWTTNLPVDDEVGGDIIASEIKRGCQNVSAWLKVLGVNAKVWLPWWDATGRIKLLDMRAVVEAEDVICPWCDHRIENGMPVGKKIPKEQQPEDQSHGICRPCRAKLL